MVTKYRSKKVYVYADGYTELRNDLKAHGPIIKTFDSQKEYRRYGELILLLKAGKITDLKRQVKFELTPNQYINGELVERASNYIADFTYIENGELVVEDVKGMRTDLYKLKRKMLLHLYGIRVKEV